MFEVEKDEDGEPENAWYSEHSSEREKTEVEKVKTMKYLGEGSRKEDIAKVIGAMRSEVLERRELNKEAKLRVFSATAVPTLLYGRDNTEVAGEQITGNEDSWGGWREWQS